MTDSQAKFNRRLDERILKYITQRFAMPGYSPTPSISTSISQNSPVL